MKFSVSGFKSIKQVNEFDFRSLTLLAGINSSGKSSLIQSLLFLKQSFESGKGLILDYQNDYVWVEQPLELIHGKKEATKLSYELELSSKEIGNLSFYEKYLQENEQLKTLRIYLDFYLKNVNGTYGEFSLNRLKVELFYGENKQREFIVYKYKDEDTYRIGKSYTKEMLNAGTMELSDLTGFKPTFKYGFMPVFCERGKDFVSLTIVNDLADTLSSFFSKINYLGPQRVKPAYVRSYNTIDFQDVGTNGENTRFMIDKNKDSKIENYGESFVNLLNLWTVERMQLAKKIYVKRGSGSDKTYYVKVENESGVEVDLCQTGFGLSQILPIITQGLLTPVGGTLIVEDPDVHMHPRVQAELVNFFADMAARGRKVIIETHSDHIVTRMRLLLAQQQLDNNSVNVCFVTNNYGHSEYRSCALTPEGRFTEKLPDGFMDSQEQDFRKIIKSQLNAKRQS